MDIKARIKDVLYSPKNETYSITFETKDNVLNSLEELGEKDLNIKVKEYKKKRSLDANAYFWVLVSKIAKKLKTDDTSIYLSLLKDYGEYEVIIVKESALDKLKSVWKYTQELGTININGKSGVQVKCYYGSSTYNTKEMSRLIDGAVYEAKELGIDTLSNEEIRKMKEVWGV